MNRAGGLRYVFAFLSILFLAGCAGGLFDKYYDQGTTFLRHRQYGEAANAFLLAARQAEKFDRGDARRIKVMRQLAQCYMAGSNFKDAENHIRQALEEMPADDRERDDLRSLLAFSLSGQAKYSEALKLRREILTALSKRLGKGHPSTLIEAERCADILVKSGSCAEAARTYQKIVQLDEMRLGKTNPELKPRLVAYASVLRKAGKKREANNVLSRARALAASTTVIKTASAKDEIKW